MRFSESGHVGSPTEKEWGRQALAQRPRRWNDIESDDSTNVVGLDGEFTREKVQCEIHFDGQAA